MRSVKNGCGRFATDCVCDQAVDDVIPTEGVPCFHAYYPVASSELIRTN
jgi:hypothetical protein